jgi:hypothetical protein
MHWNSWWAPGPGDPPAVDDPALWRAPWSLEQSIALQMRGWEALLSASHTWWAMALSAWPMAIPSLPGVAEAANAPAAKSATLHRLPPPRSVAKKRPAAKKA